MKQPATNRQTKKTHTKSTRTNHRPMNLANLKYHDNYNPQPTTKNTHQQNPPHQLSTHHNRQKRIALIINDLSAKTHETTGNKPAKPANTYQ